MKTGILLVVGAGALFSLSAVAQTRLPSRRVGRLLQYPCIGENMLIGWKR